MTKICSLKHANEQRYCTVAIKLYLPMNVTYRNIERVSSKDTNGNHQISLDIFQEVCGFQLPVTQILIWCYQLFNNMHF